MNRIIVFLIISIYLYCEISLIITISSIIGMLGVITLIILISILGIWLIRKQGIITLNNLQKQITTGQRLTQYVISSGTFIIVGILLFIPGFVSDLLAILLIIPFTQKILLNFLLDIIFKKLQFTSFISFYQQGKEQDDNIFEAEFEHKKEQDNSQNLLK